MRKEINMRVICVFLTVSAVLGVAAEKGTPEDEVAIRQVIADWKAAFNRHEVNPDAIAFAFSGDFDMVNPAGAYVKGKPDLREAFKTFLKNARKVETVDRIRFIRPDVALVDGSYEFTGTELKPYPKGVQTWVLTKENGRWLMTALRMMIPPEPAGTPPAKP
jgi:uncharacterized protein (TIGR02246 family)